MCRIIKDRVREPKMCRCPKSRTSNFFEPVIDKLQRFSQEKSELRQGGAFIGLRKYSVYCMVFTGFFADLLCHSIRSQQKSRFDSRQYWFLCGVIYGMDTSFAGFDLFDSFSVSRSAAFWKTSAGCSGIAVCWNFGMEQNFGSIDARN